MSELLPSSRLPACPMCGAVALTLDATQTDTLISVSEVLILKTLEVLGKRMVRARRSAFNELNGRPWHVVHSIWAADVKEVTKTLEHAWGVIPALMDSHDWGELTADDITTLLDSFVEWLTVTRTPYSRRLLEERFKGLAHV